MASTTDQSKTEGPALPLPDREHVLEHAAELIADAWRSFDHPRPGQPLPNARTRELLSRPLPKAPTDPNSALDAAADVLDRSLAQARPRWFAYIGSSGLEIGVLADALMASHDVNVANSAGAADLLEEQTIRWVGQFVGFDDNACGLLAAGGTIANLTALTAARERALPGRPPRGPGRPQDGPLLLGRGALLGPPRRRGPRHRRAQRPRDPDRRAQTDGRHRVRASDRQRPTRTASTPVAVVATAGTTLTGAVDDIEALAEVCGDDVWLHVDGAYGLPAASTDTAGHLFKGLRPRLLGHRRRPQMAVRPEGLQRPPDARRRGARARVLPLRGVHAARRAAPRGRPLARVLAPPARAEAVARVHRARRRRDPRPRSSATSTRRRLLASLIKDDPRFELLVEPQLSAVCFRYLPPAGVDPDEHNAALARAIAADGRILLAPAEVDGAAALRACFVNHRTTEEDVRAILTVVADLATHTSA